MRYPRTLHPGYGDLSPIRSKTALSSYPMRYVKFRKATLAMEVRG
jgi:hypothetical protein